MKHQTKSATKTITKIVIAINFFFIFLLISSSIVSAELTGEKKNIYGILTQFYDDAKSKDINKYMALQDSLYWEQALGMDNYKTYIMAVFNVTDIKDYEIIAPTILLQDNMSLVYYELKSTLIIRETNEQKAIDNDMVAFLFKYPDGWKIRYIVLREQFDYKMVSGTLNNIAAADTYIKTDNSTLKEQFLADGIISQNELDNAINSTNTASGKARASGNGSSLVWIILAVIILAIVIFMLLRKKHHRK